MADLDELGAEETVYGLKPDVDGLMVAACVLDLLINVAFDMIGATLELFFVSFLVLLVDGIGDGDIDGSSNSGTISVKFIAFDDAV